MTGRLMARLRYVCANGHVEEPFIGNEFVPTAIRHPGRCLVGARWPEPHSVKRADMSEACGAPIISTVVVDVHTWEDFLAWWRSGG